MNFLFRPYSRPDDDLIRRHWPDVALIGKLLRRTPLAIRKRGNSLGLKVRGWNGSQVSAFWRENDTKLFLLYGTKLTREIAAELGTSRGAVIGRASRLGLSAPHKQHLTFWAKRAAREAAQQPPDGSVLRLVDLERHQCRYIVSGEGATAGFCGEKTRGSSWCPHHEAIVFKSEQDTHPMLRLKAVAA